MFEKFNYLKKISQEISLQELQHIDEKDIAFDFSELFETPEKRGSDFFLDYYSPDGIEYAFEKYGIFEILKKRGFDDIKLVVETKDIFRQRLALYFEQIEPEHLLCEIVLKRKAIKLNTDISNYVKDKSFDMLVVEWLYSQNPKEHFTKERARLPGQKHPGLKTGKIILELLLITCERLGLNGLINVPSHFHNAQIYSISFSYISPEYEGKRQAIARDLLGKYSLTELSWAIELGCVYENELPFIWFVSEQVIPLDKDLKKYFEEKIYHQKVMEACNKNNYSVDEDSWQKKKTEIDNYIVS